MKIHAIVAALVAALFLSPSVQAQQEEKTHIPLTYSVAKDQIVGLWQSTVTVNNCQGGPSRTFRGTNVFHSGGTMTDTNAAPPTTRGPGFGIWAYDRHEQFFRIRMQFNRYLPDGSYDGLQDIHREARVSRDGNTLTDETIFVRVLNPDGSLRAEACGAATATRVKIQ